MVLAGYGTSYGTMGAMAVASIHEQSNSFSRTWRVKWRQDGKQVSLSFESETGALRFKGNVEQFGPEEAMRILELEEAGQRGVTVTEYLDQYISALTGVQPATIARYRSYLSRDIAPHFGDLPLSAVNEATIGRWVAGLAQQEIKDGEGTKTPSRKTMQNKHAFLSAAFKQAVKRGLLESNPCDDRRLPETRGREKVFLTTAEFELLRAHLPARYQPLATLLVLSGLRFSEATALTPDDIDLVKKTITVNKAWKYSHRRSEMKIGPPKTPKSNRAVSVPDAALLGLQLDGEYVFTNTVGNPLRAQEFFNLAWKPARTAAMEAGLKKCPRVHDLRHTHVSWLIEAGIPLPVIQNRLGHQSIRTTVDVYGSLDQRSDQAAAMVLEQMITTSTIQALPPA